MEKSVFEQIGGTYRQEGDYLLPPLSYVYSSRWAVKFCPLVQTALM